MVLTLAVLIISAMMVTAIVASSIFAVRQTTATRANVQAVAAAEAGAQLVAKGLVEGTFSPAECTGSYVGDPGNGPEYRVEVDYIPKGGAAGAWVNGCPPEDVAKLRIRSTGYARSKGVGNSTRDEAQVEILFERNESPPRFTKAIFGDLNMSLNTALTVGPDDGDLYTNGNYTCSSHTRIAGDLFVRGNATFSSDPCEIDGTVIVEGNFVCGGGLHVGGDLYVQGSITLSSITCDIDGTVWAGGTVSIPNGGTPIGGELRVRGDLNISGVPAIGSGVARVGGKIANNSGYWFDQFRAAYPSATWNDSTVGVPPSIEPSPDNVFPKLYADGTIAGQQDSIWGTWGAGDWVSAISAIRSQSSVQPCGLSAGGNYFTGPLVVNQNTVFDTRSSCDSGLTLGSTLTFRLNADAVIIASKVTMNGNVRIESGDGKAHTLYIVVPWPTGQVNCTNSGGSIEFTSGSWNQDGVAKVLLYAPNRIVIRSNPAIRGQLYACTVDANTAFTVDYAPAGDVVSDETLSSLDLAYMRDVTS